MNQYTPIRLGMVGGGQGAFIGRVHRIAARMDGHYQLVAGALASDPARAHASAEELGLDPARSYASFVEMAQQESMREDGIEVVAIVTPNHLHYPAARAFLEAGIHVICDKPLTSTLKDAQALADLVEQSGKLFVLTHNYSAYPMIRQAQSMVAGGELGRIQLVQVEYPQDWLAKPIDTEGQKQAEWRTDPDRTGGGGCIGDIGTHAWHLAGFVSGLETDQVAADLDTFVNGRRVDDNAHVMLRFKSPDDGDHGRPAKGMLWASQIAAGHENGLRLRVYGDQGSLEWVQTDPNYLWHSSLEKPRYLITRAGAGHNEAAARVTRVPAGHPEGYLEGFANIYTEAALAIKALRSGEALPQDMQCPTVQDGLLGMRFIDACIRSSKANAGWVAL